MSLSTFCQWGQAQGSPESHRRCSGANCECECHHPRKAAMTSIADYRATADDQASAEHGPEPEPTPEKRARRVFSDADKRGIVAELAAAPPGTRKVVLARHQLSSSVALAWERRYGAPTDPTRPDDPEPEPEPVDEPEQQDIAITVTEDERQVLDAVAFLDGHGSAADLVAALAASLVETNAAESDVRLVLTARRARATEAAIA